MSVCRKLPDGTIQKIAGHTILLDANASEIRQGTVTTGSINPNNGVRTTVTFTDPMPDNDYVVILSTSNMYSHCLPMVIEESKTTTGFTFFTTNLYSSALSFTVTYAAFKLVKIEGYTELQNKVSNPDEVPTENSQNLVKSGGVWEAIKNASSVFVGTRAEWAAATQTDYDIAVITDEHIILSVDKTAGTTAEQANLNKIFRGTLAEWEALSQAEKDYYDQIGRAHV